MNSTTSNPYKGKSRSELLQIYQEKGRDNIESQEEFKKAWTAAKDNLEPFDWVNMAKATPSQAAEQGKVTAETIAARAIERENKAREIYQSGRFLEFLLEEFERIWCGDRQIMQWIALSFVNGFIENADEPLHIYISGQSGLGKSEGVKAALTLLPEKFTVSGQFSRKGFLFLAPKLTPGTIVLHDDHVLDEDEAGLYRAMIASWKKPDVYYSVDRMDSKPIIPAARITQIITSADGLSAVDSNGQNESRFCTLEISRVRDDMKNIIDFIKGNPQEKDRERYELICAVWEIITSERRKIEIPFIQDIVVDDAALFKIREFKKFLTLIRCVALIRGRTVATNEDFIEAGKLWTYLLLMIDNEIPGLSPNELRVLEKIRELSAGGKRIHLSILRDELKGMSMSMIYRAFYGKNGNFRNVKGGLLTKIRGLNIDSIFNKDSGEHDHIITYFTDKYQKIGSAPYSLNPSD